MYFSLFEMVHDGVLDRFRLSDTLVVCVYFVLKIGRVGLDPNPRQTRNIGPEPDPSIHSTRPKPFGSGGPGLCSVLVEYMILSFFLFVWCLDAEKMWESKEK